MNFYLITLLFFLNNKDVVIVLNSVSGYIPSLLLKTTYCDFQDKSCFDLKEFSIERNETTITQRGYKKKEPTVLLWLCSNNLEPA